MQFQHASTFRSSRSNRRPLLAIAGAALLTVAVTGAWQTTGQQEATGTSKVQATISTKPSTPSNGSTSGSDRTYTVYLVDSALAASELQTALSDGEHIRAALGLPPFNVSVITTTSREENDSIDQHLAMLDGIRISLGEPPVNLIDRRGR